MYEKTQEKIVEFLNQKIYPSVDYAFYKNGQLEAQVLGNAQILPVEEKLSERMLFDVASLTKVVGTTTIILQLYEAGKIDLDQPVQVYLPQFLDSKVTVRHLLTHTSDINPYIANRDQLNARELRSAFYKLKSGNSIGKKAVYTDTGMILLGFLIEEIFQKNIQTVITENVLEPLQMSQSCFSPIEKQLCVPTQIHAVRGLIRGEVHDPKAYVLGANCGSAGLFSNRDDLLRFSRMMIGEGEFERNPFLTKETIAALYQDQTPEKNLHRSLGWDLKYDLRDGHPMLFHTGYTGTFLLIDQQEQEVFLFLSNRVHPEDHRDLYLEKRDEILKIYLNEKANNVIIK